MSRSRFAALFTVVFFFTAAFAGGLSSARAEDDEESEKKKDDDDQKEDWEKKKEDGEKKEEKKEPEKPKQDPVEATRLSQVTPLMKTVIWPGKKKFDPGDFPMAFTADGRVKELDMTNPYVKRLPKRIRGKTKLNAFTKLKDMEKLTIVRVALLDLSPLSALKNLHWLRLGDIPRIPSLKPLVRLTTLKTLILEDLRVKNLGPVGGLNSVEELHLVRLGLRSLDAIAPLTSLKKLRVSGNNRLKDLSVIGKFLSLEEIHLDGIAAGADLTPLAGLKKLQKVTVSVGADTKPIERIDGIEINRIQ